MCQVATKKLFVCLKYFDLEPILFPQTCKLHNLFVAIRQFNVAGGGDMMSFVTAMLF